MPHQQSQLKTRSSHFVNSLELSRHAKRRTPQRGLLEEDVRYVLCYGKRIHAADAIFYYLRRKDIPEFDLITKGRLEGTAVVTDKQSNRIITVWRNRHNGMRNLRRKLARSGKFV